jgi:multisubunit Na+/H+ antiporter MnhB subunit
MKPGGHVVLLAAARFYAPLIVLFALVLLMTRGGGAGVGFIAGLVFAVALAIHVLVFGVAAARTAFPPLAARLMLCGGLIASALGAAAPRLMFAPQIVEAGLFAVTVAASALVLTVLAGRAPTLRDEAW